MCLMNDIVDHSMGSESVILWLPKQQNFIEIITCSVAIHRSISCEMMDVTAGVKSKTKKAEIPNL